MDIEIPQELKFTKSHEWARVDGNTVTVGISAYAVDQMDKEIVNVELPEKGESVNKGESFGVVDSVKAAFDLYAPVSGEIIAVNEEAMDNPESVADSPYQNGWLIKISMTNPADLDDLMDAGAYKTFLESEE